MADDAANQIKCAGCGARYPWKAELAGKRVKCKCGNVMTVPQHVGEPVESDLFELADEPAPPQQARRAPAADGADAPVRAVAKIAGAPKGNPKAAASTAKSKTGGKTLGYRGAPAGKAAVAGGIDTTIIDLKRDVHVPIALIIIGFFLYVSYYAARYHMSTAGMALTTMGLSIMVAFKVALLFGFALAVAGPLGVSFGGIWTALLKLAAVAVFTDGITTWIDAGVAKMGGGAFAGGGTGFSAISFPIALAIYWGLLVYLFSMDPGDSWMVVMILSVFDNLIRWVIVMLLLSWVMGLSGVNIGGGLSRASSAATGGGAASDPNLEWVESLKDQKLLKEARDFIASGDQTNNKDLVEGLYTDGAVKVWFNRERGPTGQLSTGGVVIELPTDKTARAKIYKRLKAFQDEHGGYSVDTDDEGHLYAIIRFN